MATTIIKKKPAHVAANENSPASLADKSLLEAIKTFQPAIQMRSPHELKVNPRNARTHSKTQVQQLAAAIDAFGFVAPIAVDEDGTILSTYSRRPNPMSRTRT